MQLKLLTHSKFHVWYIKNQMEFFLFFFFCHRKYMEISLGHTVIMSNMAEIWHTAEVELEKTIYIPS